MSAEADGCPAHEQGKGFSPARFDESDSCVSLGTIERRFHALFTDYSSSNSTLGALAVTVCFLS